jgi:hypothetical protein
LGLNAGYYLRPSNMARPSHTKQDKRQERGQEMKYLQELTQECDYCEAMKGEACSPKCEREGK